MWDQLVQCAAPQEVAFCLPWFEALGGSMLPIYWYGILASTGIFIGTFYASKHIEWEGHDPEIIWDMLLWVVIPALLGARLWYVAQAVLGGSTAFSLDRPLDIFNARAGGMNIFGGAGAGMIAMIIYTRIRKLDGWLMADGAMLGLLLGQAIGRLGNYINQELYGPPTNSTWFGIPIDAQHRLFEYASLPPETLFHPTMFYEMGWLLASFAALYFLFRRYQSQIVHGILAGSYLILAGAGRFVIEFYRPDQPKFPNSWISYSQILALLYVIVGFVALMDRLGHMRIPWIARPQNRKQRLAAYEKIQTDKRRLAKATVREKEKEARRKARALAKAAGTAEVTEAEDTEE
jgi:phosphatidylglycerol:prolipoprotein diacylglycerol transferase